MGLLKMLIWAFVTIYGIAGVVILLVWGCRRAWSLLPSPTNRPAGLPELTGRVKR
jgi:hypothetical protein